MTIPTLIANTNSAKYRSQFKKTISTLSQAARISQSQYGFDYAGITQPCGANGATEHPDSVMSICAILNGTLTGATYFNSAEDIPVKNGGKYSISTEPRTGWSLDMSRAHAYVLADGSIFIISSRLGEFSCTLPTGEALKTTYYGNIMNYCTGYIDVNGTSLPNKEVSCSSGDNTLEVNTCVVKNDAKHMTDVFPVRIHDGIVEPASAAGRYVLRTAK